MPSSARAGSVKYFLNGCRSELVARHAGERFHLLVNVGDDAQRVGRHQSVNVRFDQRTRIELGGFECFRESQVI